MKIKVIAVGSTGWERLIRRWGVSFLIGENVLFDTFGNPRVFLDNLKKFQIALNNIKHIILSHDDWDHISGLWYIIDRYKDLTVYICPNFKQEIKDRIASFGVKIVEANGPLKIKDDIYSTGQIEGKSDDRTISEQSLIIKSNGRLIVITGCAHPGIISIIDNVRKQFNENIYLLLGGLHLKDKTKREVQEILAKLKSYRIEKIAPLHCTGRGSTGLFKEEYQKNFIEVKVGHILEV